MSSQPNLPSYADVDDKKAEISHAETVPTLSKEDDLKRVHAVQAEDDAARILAEAETTEFSVEDDKRVLRKIDLWVLTPMILIYTIQQMDKSSVSYAAVFGLQKATGLHGTMYPWLSSIVYIMQLIIQPISSYALVRLSARKWVTFNVLCWGIVTLCTAAAHNFTGLMICRALLGGFEATIAPSFIAITQTFWRRREQSWRTSMWFVANALAVVFGPLISFGVGHVKSGIEPYQGIFIFLGAITLLAVPVFYWMMPDSIATARFLNKGNDRVIAIERLRDNNMGSKNSKWSNEQAKEALTDPRTYLWMLIFILVAIPSGGFAAFGGLITQGFGFSSFHSILFQMPIGVMQILILVTCTYLINRFKVRFIVIAIVTLFPIGGAIGMTQVSRKNTNGLLGCYYVASLYGVIQPLLYGWAQLNAAGTTKRTITIAVLFVGQCIGNIIGPQVYLAREKPVYRTGLAVDIACWGGLVVAILTMAAYLKYLNKQQEKRRIAAGRAPGAIDLSILSSEEASKHREALRAEALSRGYVLNEEAFDDMTDKQNMDFHYVI